MINYTKKEELINAISHGAGAVLAIVVGVLFLYWCYSQGNGWAEFGISIQRGSLFEELYTTPDNGFYKIFIPWYADPTRTQEWYDNTLKLSGKAAMWAEYPATVEEALEVPGGRFFEEVSDNSILSEDLLTQNTVCYVAMDYGLDMLAAYWILRDAFGNSQIIHEIHEPDKIISVAADMILKTTEELVERDYIHKVEQYLAPPDLWNRSQETGKSRAILFGECGLNLTKVNNDMKAGCLAIKENTTHGEGQKSKLTIYRNCAPNLLNSLKKIQRDEKKPDIYAKDPHDLTHSVDGLRYYCIYWTHGGHVAKEIKRRKWRPDQWEDYRNASKEDRKYLVSIWGEPN